MELSSITDPVKTDLLVCFCDIQGFRRVAEATPDPLDLFRLLEGWAEIAIGAVEKAGGIAVKFIGDSALLAFPPERADAGVNALLALQAGMERYFEKEKRPAKVRFGVHYGEAVIGAFGQGRNRSIDVFGDAVNVAAALEHGAHGGRLVLSAQAFRKLLPATRRRFHKFTQPIVYLAGE